MNSTLLPSALVGLLAGGGAAAAVTVALAPDPAPVVSEALDQDNDLLSRLDGLAAQNRDLTDRLARLESDSKLAAPAAVRSAPNSAEDLAALQAELQAALDNIQSPVGLPPQKFEEMVAAATENIDARKREERAAERSAREAEQLETRLAELATELGLDQGQVGRMRDTLTDLNTKRTAFFEEARNGDFAGGRDEIRKGMQALTEESNIALQTFLTPSQYEQYTESQGDNGGRGGGRGGGGRGGGRGGF